MSVLVPKPVDPDKPKKQKPPGTGVRAATAGLSAVGAGAGALGLGVGAKEVLTHGWKGTPRLTRSLIPVELAGLGGEVMATKILHSDVKQQRQTVAKGHGMEICSGGSRGKRIREGRKPSKVERLDDEAVAKAFLAAVPKVAGKAVKRPETIAEMGARMRGELGQHLTGALKEKGEVIKPVGKAAKTKPKNQLGDVANLGVDGTFMGQAAASHLERAKIHRDRGNQLHMEAIEEESALKRRQALAHLRQAALLEHSAKQKTIGAVGAMGLKDGMGSAGLKGTGEGDKVRKARSGRRFDPEADRQRRLGLYSGAALGGGIVTGEMARRQFDVSREVRTPGTRTVPGRNIEHAIGFKPLKTRKGLLLAGATAGLGALAAGTYKRGVSRRNQTWT